MISPLPFPTAGALALVILCDWIALDRPVIVMYRRSLYTPAVAGNGSRSK
jgi:ABC-type microcin C transport system permease subunit YejE